MSYDPGIPDSVLQENYFILEVGLLSWKQQWAMTLVSHIAFLL